MNEPQGCKIIEPQGRKRWTFQEWIAAGRPQEPINEYREPVRLEWRCGEWNKA